MTETSTSSGAGATPPTGTPATGTPAPGSATPPVAALTLEAALKRIAELELHAQNKTEEASRHGTKLTAAEKELAAYKAAEQAAKDAQLSEVERMTKERAALQEQYDNVLLELQEARIFQAVAQNAGKHNFAIPHDMIVRLLNWDDIEFDEASGKPTNVGKLLEKLAHDAPDLVKSAQLEQQQQRQAPQVPAMNPGRSSITQPGQQQPGRIPRLTDQGLWKS